ncbi:MAG: glycosyl hydrolase [Candidatus Eremiobacterota bacterium]
MMKRRGSWLVVATVAVVLAILATVIGILVLAGSSFEEPEVEVARSSESTPQRTPREPKPQPRPRPRPSRTPTPALRLPGPDRPAVGMSAELERLRKAARASGMASDWRRLGDRAVEEEFYSVAADAYTREAAVYRAKGDPHGARAQELRAARYATEIELYRPGTSAPAAPRARLEPESGCLIGAFIDRDDSLGSMMLQSQIHGDIQRFNEVTGKRHASFFMYREYGQPFPSDWARYVREQGAIPHIAWEPRDLKAVRQDDYLAGFVREVQALDWPVFIRFAGEMNGEWTSYHGDPAAYRRAFRTVYQAFRSAPKAAVMWCPNSVPVTGLEDYYPGDDACDWVGINLYSVLFLDNDPARPGEAIHPADLLEPVYRRYAARKPIAVGEYAATHQAAVAGGLRSDFAVTKLCQLYHSLPLRYPRLKLISWYDCNNLVHARPGRQLNNYLLTDQPEILDAYRETVASDYFLDSLEGSARGWVPLKGGQSASVLEAWVRTYVNRPQVYFRLDGKVVARVQIPERCRLDLTGCRPGLHRVEVLVYDDRNRFVDRRVATVRAP